MTKLAPPLQGLEAHTQGGGWWYLTWDTVPSATGYEEDHEFNSGRIPNPKTSIFAIPNGDQRACRIRALGAGGTSSPWVKVTLRWDGTKNIEVEGDVPPPVPATPVISKATAGHTSVAAWWDHSTGAVTWNAYILNTDGELVQAQDELPDPQVVFNDLEPDTIYQVQAQGVAADGKTSAMSTPVRVRTKADDPGDRPRPPANLAAHCITTISAQVTWDNDPIVDDWTISINGDPAVTVHNGRRFNDLEPDTEYTIVVTARSGDKVSDPSRIVFSTLPNEEVDPEAPLPRPKNLIVQAVSATEINVEWDQDGDVSAWMISIEPGKQRRVDKRIHGQSMRFTGLTPGVAYTVRVYAVNKWDLSPIATQAVTLSGGTPS